MKNNKNKDKKPQQNPTGQMDEDELNEITGGCRQYEGRPDPTALRNEKIKSTVWDNVKK